MAMNQRGAAPDLFVCVVYVTPIGSKHESESLFQNLAVNTTEVQTLGGIVLLGGDFNACTATLLDTINTGNLCEFLQALKFIETKQLGVWLNDRIATPLLVIGAASSWTYVVTLGYSSSMAGHLVTNKGNSFV
jgi:hypothetical protein